jgi:AraC family transcriptional activator of pobA
MVRPAIPSYTLYGEREPAIDSGFAHIETIAARSSLNDWEIKPHRHADFVQMLLVHRGQVRISFDGAVQALEGRWRSSFRPASSTASSLPPTWKAMSSRSAPILRDGGRDGEGDGLHRVLTRGQAAPLAPEPARRAAWLAGEMLALQVAARADHGWSDRSCWPWPRRWRAASCRRLPNGGLRPIPGSTVLPGWSRFISAATAIWLSMPPHWA